MRFISLLLCIISILMLASCAPLPEYPATGATTSTTSADTPETNSIAEPVIDQLPMTAVSLPVITETELASDGKLLFEYKFQNISLTLQDPDIAQSIAMELLDKVETAHTAAADLQSYARSAYTGQDDWSPCSYSILFTPVRVDQSILSICSEEVSYNGGHRSVAVTTAYTYDLITGNRLSLSSVLTHDYSADVLCNLIITALTGHPSKDSLFWDYEEAVRDRFQTNTPIETWYLSETGLCIYFTPYEIAPYSAGTVVAEIPYESLNGVINDQYFPAELADF